jgi:hypothetical protein
MSLGGVSARCTGKRTEQRSERELLEVKGEQTIF